MFISNPNIDTYLKNFCENTFNRALNRSFKGYVSVPYDDKYCYYAIHSNNDTNMYLPVLFFERDYELGSELYDIDSFIKSKLKQYNKNLLNNNFVSKEDIVNLFLPNIYNLSTEEYCSTFKYILFFEGCDDGHHFYRFNSEESRNLFFVKILEGLSAEQIFNYEDENLVLHTFN